MLSTRPSSREEPPGSCTSSIRLSDFLSTQGCTGHLHVCPQIICWKECCVIGSKAARCLHPGCRSRTPGTSGVGDSRLPARKGATEKLRLDTVLQCVKSLCESLKGDGDLMCLPAQAVVIQALGHTEGEVGMFASPPTGAAGAAILT